MFRFNLYVTLFLMALALHSAASARVIRVCAGRGAAYTSIQSGVTAATSGDVVKVCPGNYTESVLVAKSEISIVGQGRLGAVKLTCPAPGQAAFSIASASRDTIRNFDISGCNEGVFIGASVAPATGNQIVRNRIHDNAFFGVAIVGNASGNTTSGNLIILNTLLRNGTGVAVNSSADDQVDANLVVGTNEPLGTFGIVISSGLRTQVSYNIIQSHSTALELANSSNTTVDGNQTLDNWYFGVSLFDHNTGNTVIHNSADKNGIVGILADATSTNNSFVGNNAHGNGYNASLLFVPGADVEDDDTNTWQHNLCDVALGNATCDP